MLDFRNLIYTLESWGVLDVVLPFILIFTIVFAIMEQTKILGKDDTKAKKYGVVIALVVAASVVIAHVQGIYYNGFDPVLIINNALPQVGLLLVAIVMMLLTIGLWTGKKADGTKGHGVWFTVVSAGIVVAIFAASLGFWQVPYWISSLLNSNLISIVVALLMFGLVIKFIVGEPKKEGAPAKKSAADGFKDFFGGK